MTYEDARSDSYPLGVGDTSVKCVTIVTFIAQREGDNKERTLQTSTQISYQMYPNAENFLNKHVKTIEY